MDTKYNLELSYIQSLYNSSRSRLTEVIQYLGVYNVRGVF